MNKVELRSALNDFKPYMRDSSFSIDAILDMMSDGLLKYVEKEYLIRGDVVVKQTSDYDVFKSITSNREVDKKHIKKLVDSISKKNLLYIRPLLVNESMEVIDGQHRLEACIILNIPVPYMICPGLMKEDIHFLNSVQKNWTTMDFINYFTLEDKRGYREFSRLANEFPRVRVSILLKLCSSSRNQKIRDGIMDVGRLDEARTICHYLNKLNNFWKKKAEFDFVYSASFATALQKCLRNDDFKLDRLYEQVSKNQELFVKYTSRNEYLRSIHMIYNMGRENDIVKLAPHQLI